MRKKVRFLLAGLLVADVLLIGYLMYDYIQNKIPDSVLTYVGEKQELDLPAFFKTEQSVPALHVQNQDGSFSMKSNRLGSYEVSVRLFGVLPVKRMDVKVVKRKKIFPSGEPIGIYVETNGLLVLDTTEVPAKDGLTYAPGENLLKPGDYILEWNQKKVATIQSLNREIQGTKDKKVTVLIRRNGEKIKIAMRPVLSSDGTYKIGTWVREDTQGIGTLTYVTKTGEFGTLGHGITDVDTGTLLNLHGGELFQTQIVDIMKGEKGNPGELQGYINMNHQEQMLTFYKVIYSERSIQPMAARIVAEETERMIIATKQLFYAMEVHKLLHFENADMSAVSFAMTVHGLMDYELDQKYGYDEAPKNLLDEYLKWFCEENAV